jgi:glycopeptide antibiotics resistance protein
VKRFGRIGLAVSLALAFAIDYPWSNWVGHTHWSRVGWIPFYSWPVSLRDIVENVLLFLPAGVCARLAFGDRGRLWGPLLSFPVAFVGEWTQLYSHSRFPSATDLVCNVLGSMAGVWVTGEYLKRRTLPPWRRS